MTANALVSFLNISHLERKSKSSLVFFLGEFELNISNVTGYAAELEQRFLTVQSAMQSHVGVFMPYGRFHAMHLHV